MLRQSELLTRHYPILLTQTLSRQKASVKFRADCPPLLEGDGQVLLPLLLKLLEVRLRYLPRSRVRDRKLPNLQQTNFVLE